MPGLDHEIHPSVRHGPDFRYGCNGLPAELNHRMSDRCRYDLSLKDAGCTDCPHRGKGEAYDAMVRSRGT